MRWGETGFAAGVVAVAGLLLVFPGTTGADRTRGELIGPTVFPSLTLAACIVIFSAIAIRGFLKARRQPDVGEEKDAPARLDYGSLAFVLLWTFLFILAIGFVGFPLASLLFQAGVMFVLFRIRRLWSLVLVPLVLTAIYLVLFVVLLNIPLPRGSGVFYSFNQLLY